MRIVLYFAFFFFMNCSVRAFGQDTLPHINVINYNGRIVVSWQSNYAAAINNITIQRSFDSLKNYTTIGSVLNPQNRENGYADERPPYNKMYYRVFISFAGGNYIFSEIKRPVKDTGRAEPIVAKVIDSIITQQEQPKPKGWIASRRIYTGRENNIILNLPEALTKKYSVKFFDEEENPVFTINKINETYLTIEKVNFVHSGWFYFELFENGISIEKNKVYVPKDGKNQGIPPDEQGKSRN